MPDDLYDPAYDDVDLPPDLGDELRDKIIALTEFKTELDHVTAPRDLD